MKQLLAQMWAGKRDLVLVGLVVGILILLFLPIPSQLLDLLLVINISTALLILLVTFFTETPLKFSTFPTILLLVTMFRLALNVSATRLILEGTDAGRVINAIGEFVIGGNYVVGIVVFLILVVVQYVVVTNGAQRVAEVAARFTLDSMPGKQMAIDADMNMGLIDEHEARRRRALIEREANFYGSMDGATKFVKGDAIAGIIIILINIVGGLAIGIVQLGMPWAEAVQRFTLLTVGDGIVTQIPSLVIAVATGIIITRTAADGQLGAEIPRQVLANPRALVIVGIALLAILLLPGFPKLPVLAVLAALGALIYYTSRAARQAEAPVSEGGVDSPADSRAGGAVAATGGKDADDLQQVMRIEPIEIRLGSALTQALLGPEGDLADRIAHLRRQLAQDLGYILPKVHTGARAELGAEAYEILVQGSRVGQGELKMDRILAINPGGNRQRLDGQETRDPAYGLPAQWIAKESRQFARGAGYTLVDPDTVLMTHLTEVGKRHAPDLLTRAETERLVQRLREQHASLIDELVPGVLSYSDVQKVLQCLLREQVSIRNLEAVLEVLVDAGKSIKSPEDLAERVRERLGPSICQKLSDGNGDLHVLTLGHELERTLLASQRIGDVRGPLFGDMGQMDAFMKSLGRQAEAMMGRSLLPVLLCPSPLRRPLRALIQRSLPYVAVVGVNEVPPSTLVRSFASVQTIS
ncbi:MAG: flagellar biosynthesis protein FlhA [Rhizobium sp.]|nr:flagellar biosynthesis protein FlhA [Rhizobium sp.]